MKNLFCNELTKIKYSLQVKVVLGLFLFLAVIFGIVPPEGKRMGMFAYAYGFHFQFLASFGRIVLFLFAPVAIAMITQEFSQRTIANLLTRGVGRGNYYFVKTVCLMGTCCFLYLACAGVSTLLKGLLFGWNPQGLHYPDYAPTVFVYHFGVLLTILAEMALFIFISCLADSQPAAYFGCLGVCGAEALLLYRREGGIGLAVQTLANMSRYVETHTVLTWQFAGALALPFLELVLFWGLGYRIFRRKDIR